MEKETLYALVDHRYDNAKVVAGEPYLVRKKHSQILIALGRAERRDDNVIQLKPQPAVEIDEKEAVRAEYKAIFGKSAPGRSSVESLRAEIEKEKAGNE